MNNSSLLKHLRWIFPFVLCPLVLSGCWDRREINDVAFVLASSIDKENDLYRISILIPLPGNMGGASGGGGGTGGVEPYTIETEAANTIWEAVDKIQSRLPRKIFFAHRRVLLFGEDIAKDGMTIPMNYLADRPENRLSTFVAVTKGKAMDLLGAKVKLERFSAELMRELLQSDATIKTSEKDIITNMNLIGKDAFIPYLELNKAETNGNKSDEIVSTGFAITNNGKEVAVLKNNDALALRLLAPKFSMYSQRLKIDGERFSYQVRNVKTVIKPIINGNQINFEISVVAMADINEFLSTKDIFEEMPKFQKIIESQMKKDLLQVLDILKTKGSDVVGFGQILNRHYPERWSKDWEPQWNTVFAKTNFKVTTKVHIYDIGALSGNMVKKGN
ncbi:Ger(x)C family spore germination protein [Paenibacillus psychroresistens]|uniref:Ger(X)C family spore germination protein n=1 Tax=Paenibacillus psychroresistens TaxID=1778678 RepID=A0A6B8RNJ1_9BACL|nr:Ger(x)C family spore germination protein [Paenibacillus psychroresistens]QGQ97125.1 Ger(x)C family spore germination protein [Paenibacillus psychroresistens]